MFTKINDTTKIDLDFNDGIQIKIDGPENWYYVEIREFVKNSSDSFFLEGYHISPKINPCWQSYIFKYSVSFYFDFEILVYRCDLIQGLTQIFHHRYNDNGKFVKFNIVSNSKNESTLWVNKCIKYCKIHGCKPLIKSGFEDLNKNCPNYYVTSGIDPYKTYNIGRFPKNSTDFKTYDPRKENKLWFGFWREFWSYQHPRPWNKLSSQEIVDDILGL